MPSEPSDGIFDALAVYRRRVGAVKYPNRHSRQHRNLETRHSRAGGNPVGVATVFFTPSGKNTVATSALPPLYASALRLPYTTIRSPPLRHCRTETILIGIPYQTMPIPPRIFKRRPV
ncbi:TPA: hypothetical protein ACQUJH_000646 [Neisseria cinerea]